jgi:hypothetical protein
MKCHHIDKYVNEFTNKNFSNNRNVVYTIKVLILVLMVVCSTGHTINSKAISPNGDTIFYRIKTNIHSMEKLFWAQSLDFIRSKKRKLSKTKVYVIIDETYESYTGRLFIKAKKARKNKIQLTDEDKFSLKYLHKYKPKKGDTGSYKYLVIALVYGNKRRVIAIKALKRKEKYKTFIINKLIELKKEIKYEFALFDRGFYDGNFIFDLEKNNIPFILRAKLSKSIKKLYDFPSSWKAYTNNKVGDVFINSYLVLGKSFFDHKLQKMGFITNVKFDNWFDVKKIYKKRWDIENIFKATDGIQIKAQTNNPNTKMFFACFSFLIYNCWQNKNKRKNLKFFSFIVKIIKLLFDKSNYIFEFMDLIYRDRFKIDIAFFDMVIDLIKEKYTIF